MPELTSLKVPRQVRDRFAAAAAARGTTVRALLDELSRSVLDAVLLERSAEQMRRMRDTDPDEWSAYIEEGRVWEEGSIERVDS
jgi:hypothetical protein